MPAAPQDDAARWPVLSPLLDELLELAEEARARRLSELARDDGLLAAELSDLLSRREVVEDSGFLEGPVLAAAPSTTLEGRRVGAYTVERLLGQGGMGTVWLARRSDGRFEGRAAVKFLNLGLLGSGGAARFELEGSILARLSHPNIAHLIDAGVADGQPFLVLEYVEGERMDEWCDARTLGLEARIRLFLSVLGAVAHAHDRLVLHRDLKPSNILVTAEGQPKLLDFGVAKLLEGGAAAGQATELTGLAGRPFTPGYGAPEQVQGGDVTTATDVYALGVVLFHLLAGAPPIADPATAASAFRLAPDRPAERASQVAARTPADLARRRGAATPTELARTLRGDLDNVLAKALEVEPGKRYPTVHALADDLERHLSHQPVAARAGSLAYRLGKAARRHRLAFGAAALVALALAGGVAATAWEAVEAGHQRSRAVGERERADREARRAREQRDFAFRQLSRAEAVADLDDFLLYEAAPNGKPFTALDLLGRAERIVSRQEPAADPNRVEQLIALGRQYGHLEEMDRSRRLLEEAYALSREIEDPSTRAKAGCALAGTLARAGDGARGERLVAEALAALPEEPQFAMARIGCLRAGASVARDSGDPPVAVERARAALAQLGRLEFPAGFLETRLAMDLAEAYRMAGRLPEAAAAWARAADLLTALGRADTETATTLFSNWGTTLLQLGQPLEAEARFRRVLRIEAATAGGVQRRSPTTLNELARALEQLDRLPEAARLVRQALDLARRTHQEVAVNQTLLLRALIDCRTGDLQGAAASLAEVAPRLTRMLPPGHYAFAALESYRSVLAQARGDLGAARAAADRALSIAEASGQGPWIQSSLLTRRAELELEAGEWEGARRDADLALERGRALVGETAPARQLGLALLARGRALHGLGDVEGARRAFESASEQLRACLGPAHPLARTAARLAAAR